MVRVSIVAEKTSTDKYRFKYTTRSHKAPKWIKQMKHHDDLRGMCEDGVVPNDVAIALRLRVVSHIDVRIVSAEDILDRTHLFRNDDLVMVHWGADEVLYDDCDEETDLCPKRRDLYLQTLLKLHRDPSCPVVYPYPDLHMLIMRKAKLYPLLQSMNVAVAPFHTFQITGSTTRDVVHRIADTTTAWGKIVLKPAYSGYSQGIKIITFSRKKQAMSQLMAYVRYLHTNRFPDLVAQRYVPSFKERFELRTYWVRGKYAMTIGTLMDLETDRRGDDLAHAGWNYTEDTFADEKLANGDAGSLPRALKRRIVKVGKAVLRALPQHVLWNPVLRLDFGCCLDSEDKDGCRLTYFLNEVESIACSYHDEDVAFPIVESIAKAIATFARHAAHHKAAHKRPGTPGTPLAPGLFCSMPAEW